MSKINIESCDIQNSVCRSEYDLGTIFKYSPCFAFPLDNILDYILDVNSALKERIALPIVNIEQAAIALYSIEKANHVT